MAGEAAAPELERPPLHVPGLIGIIVFYLVILGVGLFASWRKKTWRNQDTQQVMVAGRNIGVVVGVFTMTATWVGGGFINGTAEAVFNPNFGLVWAQAPFGYAISLILGGIFFAKRMREKGYITMLDPFEHRYGRLMTSLLYLPALLGEVLWCGAILAALGASLSVILGLDQRTAVIVSAAIAVCYTLLGGLYSVAFTDVVQLICIFIGLWLSVPFAMSHPAVTPISLTAHPAANRTGWLGALKPDPWVGNWLDAAMLLIFGGMPWQVYFQRVLSSRSPGRAQALSFVAAAGCLIMAIPAVLIGAIGASTDWNATLYRRYAPLPIPEDDYKLILPLVLQYLCPAAVSVIGLGAVSAAVMSSADSSVLSASSMFAKNVYAPVRNLCGPEASDREILWVMRVSILLVGAVACVLAIVIKSVYRLFFLCGDLVYVILFPQLTCVVFYKYANAYGALVGFLAGCFFRFSGEDYFFPPLIEYVWYDFCKPLQCFPYKTLAMLINLLCILVFSLLARWLFRCLPASCDCLRSFEEKWTVTHDVDFKVKRSDVIRETLDGGKENPAFYVEAATNANKNYITSV